MISMLCVSGALVNTKNRGPAVCSLYICFVSLFLSVPINVKLLLLIALKDKRGFMRKSYFLSLEIASGGHIIRFMNNSGGFAVYISWFRHLWIENNTISL